MRLEKIIATGNEKSAGQIKHHWGSIRLWSQIRGTKNFDGSQRMSVWCYEDCGL
jgi:hypothetical protein